MKVALIDDSALVRRNLRAALQKLGHEPTEVEPRSVFEVLKVEPSQHDTAVV